MDALTTLTAAGWHPGRRVDVEQDRGVLEAEGFTVTPAAESFLEEYSGLEMTLPERLSPLVISGATAARHLDASWCEAYSEEINAVLVPVGEYSMMTLFVDPCGDVWGAVDHDFGRLGSSLIEVINDLLSPSPSKTFDRHVE